MLHDQGSAIHVWLLFAGQPGTTNGAAPLPESAGPMNGDEVATNKSYPVLGFPCLLDSSCRQAFGVSRPYCSDGDCVQCVNNGQCSALGTSKPYCSVSGSTANTCVACDNNSHCETGVCSADKVCVECLNNDQCTSSTLPYCSTSGKTAQTCVACNTDSHCPDGLLCSPEKKCVQCLDSEDCVSVTGLDGTPLPYCATSEWCSECNGLDRTCDKENLLGVAVCSIFGECMAQCETDADCLSDLHPYCDANNSGQCASCQGDAEGCPDGLQCYAPNGEVPRCIECLDNDMCDDGLVCDPDRYRCQECVDNEDCPGAYLCANYGRCQQCLDNSDCPSRVPLCSQGYCVACEDDADCPSYNPRCSEEDHRCYACLGDEDCESPLAPFCISNACQACRTDTDCPEDFPTCSSGQCIQCLVDAECDDGRRCDPQSRSCVSCTVEDADDPTCPTSTPLCSSGYCQECISSTDCPNGVPCTDGVCSECTSNDACATLPVPTYKTCLADGDIYRCVSNLKA